MKLKYKKWIVMSFLSTMGIGLLTLTLTSNHQKAMESAEMGADRETNSLITEKDDTENITEVDNSSINNSSKEPTITPTLTSIPVYSLEENSNPKIDTLMKDYYTAKINFDISKLKKISTNPSEVPTEEVLKSKTDYIEDYLNMKCYTKKGAATNTYIVYVYTDIKIVGINTPAPSLAQFYVTVMDGDYKIFNDTLDEVLEEYYKERNKDEDIKELKQKVNKKAEEAKSKDEDLLTFWQYIDSVANSNN